MATKPPPELLPFLDSLAKMLADQAMKELRMSPERANPPTTSNAPLQMKNKVSVAPLKEPFCPGRKGPPKDHQRTTKGPRKG